MNVVLVLTAVAGVLIGALLAVRARAVACASGVAADDAAARLGIPLGRLLAVAAIGVPVLWIALDAQVAEWPGLMCVQGVLNLGRAAGGAAALLPWMLGASVAAKAALLVAAGCAMVLRGIDRSTRDAALAPRAARWALAAGVLAIVDGAATVAWVAIPRDAPDVPSGCCSVDTTRLADERRSPVGARTAWTAAFLASAGAAAGLLALASRTPSMRRPRAATWPAAGAAAGATVVTGTVYASVALAPARLRLPLHECAFCLLDRAPENWIGAAGLVGTGAFTAWAWVAARAADTPGAEHAADARAVRMLRCGAVSAAAAGVLGAAGRWLP